MSALFRATGAMMVDGVTDRWADRHQCYEQRYRYSPVANIARLKYDLSKDRKPVSGVGVQSAVIPSCVFESSLPIWLDIGAGSGEFFASLAKLHTDRLLVAVERSRHRGARLIGKSQACQLDNFIGLRGNAVRAVTLEIPTESIERIYLMYPCPWPKNSHRKNRWYLHPLMKQLFRVLVPGGQMIWASDQQFYIEEARWVSEQLYRMQTLVCGRLASNAYNDLEFFGPRGRTRFEQGFLGSQAACYELVCQKQVTAV